MLLLSSILAANAAIAAGLVRAGGNLGPLAALRPADKSEWEKYFDFPILMRELRETPAEDNFSQRWALACERNNLVAAVGNGRASTLPLVGRGDGFFVVDPLGFTRREVEKMLPRLSVSVGARIYDVDDSENGLLKFSFASKDLPRHVSVYEVPEMSGIVFGLAANGWMASKPDDWPHMLVSGTTGSGKSVFLKFLALQVVACYADAQLLIATPKPKDFRAFRHGRVRVITAMPEFTDLLEQLETERERRELSASDRHAPVFLVIDEFNAMLNDENIETMNRIVTMSRSANYHCVFSAQRPTIADSKLTGQIRENLEQRICFRVKTATDSEKAVGSRLAYHLPRVPGRAVYDNLGRSVEIQVPFVSDTEIGELLKKIP